MRSCGGLLNTSVIPMTVFDHVVVMVVVVVVVVVVAAAAVAVHSTKILPRKQHIFRSFY